MKIIKEEREKQKLQKIRNEKEAFSMGVEDILKLLQLKFCIKEAIFCVNLNTGEEELNNLINLDEMQSYCLRKNQEISLTGFFRSLKNN